ncbi:cupin domain-containing protein [Parachitinimonas caeni]|uniref:Cupin domain-containing protein n=1 Tax=Parachitinimonas caeni TaxID=3031301 RepID=A0ABT7DW51_9NEIS|nr:cupin domain-containing protein [Parachitinimonas caeni]MDK2124271.1 cupin domain-containing protein [Parachitinimonas caeni]
MPATKIVVFSENRVEPVLDHPRSERLVSGNPQRNTWTQYQQAGLSCGIWSCEPGAWRIQFAADKHEFFCVLEGKVRIHDEAGNFSEIGPGEAAVIPAGFRGRFEVVEAVRKYFVVYEGSAPV